MRHVDITGYGGVRYGYVYHPKKDKLLKEKIAKLQEFGCKDITHDVGEVKNMKTLLNKATFRDHILFFDHAAFKTVDELHAMYELGLGSVDGTPGFVCDFYDKGTLLDLGHSPEDTARNRRRRARQQKLGSSFSWLQTSFWRGKRVLSRR
jgi:hypothetical protein